MGLLGWKKAYEKTAGLASQGLAFANRRLWPALSAAGCPGGLNDSSQPIN